MLSQVDVAIKSIQLSDDPSAVPHSQHQKHHNSVKLAAQQQLLALDLGLQTYKLALEHLDHLNKLLKHPEAAQAGELLNNLYILLEVCFLLYSTSFTNSVTIFRLVTTNQTLRLPLPC